MVLQLHVSFTWLDNTKTANICLYKKEKNKAEHHKYKQNFKNVFNRDFEILKLLWIVNKDIVSMMRSTQSPSQQLKKNPEV